MPFVNPFVDPFVPSYLQHVAHHSYYLSPSNVLRKGMCCGCGVLSLSSSIIIKKRRPIIKSRTFYNRGAKIIKSMDQAHQLAVTSSGIVQRRVLATLNNCLRQNISGIINDVSASWIHKLDFNAIFLML
jgi:hypothetical protein